MRKVLLTVMMVSSLLAFNACKKDGAVGPAGPKGDTGAAGAAGVAGPVGAAGAAGKDGTKILSGTVDPTTEGVAGDFYFNKTTKTLWGPKVAAGWAGTSTGLTGPAGNQFLAGAGVPDATNPTNAKTGDFYFDTNTSTFYGPKAADGTWTSVLPLSSGYGAKAYTLTKGFESIKENAGVRVYGQDLVETVNPLDFTLFTTYQVTAIDMIRIAQYPGWISNREMKVEAVAGSNVFNTIVTAANLGAINVGTKFVYTNKPTVQFDLTQDDKDRLLVSAGAAFNYLTYATAQNITQGTNLVLATKKNVQVKNSTTKFATTYKAVTKFDLPALVGVNFEKYKQEGKVFVKFKYYTAKTATGGNTPALHQSANAGWVDLSVWANSFVVGTGAAGYDLNAGINPFSLDALANNFMASGQHLGYTVVPTAVAFAPSQGATAVVVAAGAGVVDPTTFNKGNVTINWNIASGVAAAPVATVIGDAYYNLAASNLTATNPDGTALAITPPNTVLVSGNTGGLEVAGIQAVNLVQVQVLVFPAQVVTAAKAKGVDVNNAEALNNFIKL